MRSSSLCRLFGLTILLVLSHLICLGQQSATAGSLTGTVSDYTGAAIAGATVTVTDSATNQTRVSTSDEQGRYRFSSLRPDTYSVRSQAPGFEERGPRLVSVELGRSVVVDITLLPRGARYNVTVPVGQPEIDLTQTAAATSIDTESVEELPVNSRNYLQFALLAPGVAPSQNSSQTGTSTRSTSPLGDSGFTFGGLRARSNSIAIDGLTNIDETTGASLIVLSPEIVREFQVINNGISAEFGGAAGGTINVITKTGSNAYHGTAFTFIQNEHLNARNPIDASTALPLYRRYQPGFSLGGPLRKDKLFFYIAAEQENLHADDRTEIARSTVRTPINAALAGGFAPRLPVRELSGSTFRAGADETELAGKLTWIANAKNTVNTRLAYTNNRDRGEAFNVDALADPTARGTLFTKDFQLTSLWTSVIGSDNVNELRAQYSTRRFISRAGVQSGPEIDVVGLAKFGDPWDADSNRRERRTEIVDTFLIPRKAHELKFGGNVNHVALDASVSTRVGGLYTFRSVADFLAARPAVWRQAFGPTATTFGVTSFGAFAQDRWQIARNVTLNLGGRYDVETLPAPFRTDNNNFSPRLGMAWAVAKDFVIRGGFGIFYDRLPLAFLAPAVKASAGAFEQVAFDNAAATIFAANGGGTVTTPVAGIAPSIYRVDPTFVAPYSIQAFAGAEKQIAEQTTVRGEFLFTRGLHLTRTRNVNLAPPVSLALANAASLGVANPTPQQFGRPVFGPARIDPRYNAIYQLETSASSKYHGLSLSLRHSFSEEITALASYTLAKATDDASDFFEQPANPYDLRSEVAPSSLDVRHRLVVSGVFELPVGDDEEKGKAKQKESFLSELLGDIEVAPIVTFSSGRPYTPLTGIDEERNLAYPFASRPLGVARNSLRLPSFFNTDIRVVKYIPFSADKVRRLDLSFEFFNLFNHPNVASLNPYFGSDLVQLPTYQRPILFETPRQFRFSLDMEW